MEFAEYIAVGGDDQIVAHTYTFHWQDVQKQLIRRWDNVNHFPQLPNAPHHIHHADGTVVGNPNLPNLVAILTEIEDN